MNDFSPAGRDEAPPPPPFLAFTRAVQVQGPERARITEACRMPEAPAVVALLDAARLSDPEEAKAEALARHLVETLRARRPSGGVEGLIREYDLSSQEGVALMCLAEALLRIPDRATRDALIRDKIGRGDWQSHLGHSPSLFVNAATWGLLVTGKLSATRSEAGLAAALTRLTWRGGEPLIRRGVDMAMRLMGEQFVTGQTIEAALAASRRLERQGFRYSYDMLGEAALTADDAKRYTAEYERAIHAIGRASDGRGIVEGPGISIKLSALHPRYSRAQRERVMGELLPRLADLAVLARGYDIGLNIDAEESERLDLSLDLLEALCGDPRLAGWSGIGFVVQAYQKRAPFVIDWVAALARRTGRRIMLRLVKGAYWDSEIKRAQQDGLDDFPVFTRKAHTDVSYLACARRMLQAPDALFAQFATHNARTLASIAVMAGEGFQPGQYEFQCLHGMGEPLYEEVVGTAKLDRPCRIYAPVGTHETLLAYLVRRLLENGANSSFVNRVADTSLPLSALTDDPARLVAARDEPGRASRAIALPAALYGPGRRNSRGLDLASEHTLGLLAARLAEGARGNPEAAPPSGGETSEPVRNPADARDVVGHVRATSLAAIPALCGAAARARAGWAATPAAERARILALAADRLEAAPEAALGLIVREAGRILSDALGEVRETVDFLRYYAVQLVGEFGTAETTPLGNVVCISPWNFPLAIFTGQVAAALAAGNAVLAKPAPQTPLIAALAVRLLHEAGVPEAVLQLVPGGGPVGAALVEHPAVDGVMFTGSTTVARAIQQRLARRLGSGGRPVVLVAETGGLNAMVVDSSALAEQVVGDAVFSAFNSAGQRCSALRLLCLQEDIAVRTLAMLRGAMAELAVGPPARLETDIGPVIDAAACARILGAVDAMRAAGHPVHVATLGEACRQGSFAAPTLIEVQRVSDLKAELFGPVLHVLRYPRRGLDDLLRDLRATGYGLTFGVHTRLDETVAALTSDAPAGNVYVNRNMIGAVVGVQPFGGHGLSGTGPKAGGPLLLRRLMSRAPDWVSASAEEPVRRSPAALALEAHLRAEGEASWAERTAALAARSPVQLERALPGPVGEQNLYRLGPSGAVLCRATTAGGLWAQLAAVLATGNIALVDRIGLDDAGPDASRLARLPAALTSVVREAPGPGPAPCVALFEGEGEALLSFGQELARREGTIVPVLARTTAEIEAGLDYEPELLLRETRLSINTAAAGGNASLMSLGESDD